MHVDHPSLNADVLQSSSIHKQVESHLHVGNGIQSTLVDQGLTLQSATDSVAVTANSTSLR
jgi:hypothetical protein